MKLTIMLHSQTAQCDILDSGKCHFGFLTPVLGVWLSGCGLKLYFLQIGASSCCLRPQKKWCKLKLIFIVFWRVTFLSITFCAHVYIMPTLGKFMIMWRFLYLVLWLTWSIFYKQMKTNYLNFDRMWPSEDLLLWLSFSYILH